MPLTIYTVPKDDQYTIDNLELFSCSGIRDLRRDFKKLYVGELQYLAKLVGLSNAQIIKMRKQQLIEAVTPYIKFE